MGIKKDEELEKESLKVVLYQGDGEQKDTSANDDKSKGSKKHGKSVSKFLKKSERSFEERLNQTAYSPFASKSAQLIENTNKKRDIKSLNRLLLDVDYKENADEAEQLINNLADAIFASSEMRADFVDATKKHLSDYLARANEQNPPSVPEQKYQPRQVPIVEFLKEVWGEWLDRGLLTKQILNSHDPKAYDALINWERKNSLNDVGLKIRSKPEENDQFLERTYFTKDEAFRVVGALNRRT